MSHATSMRTDTTTEYQLPSEDLLRADMYSLIAALLRTEPSDLLIQHIQTLEGDTSPLGSAINTLAKIARSLDNAVIRQEYFELFIGMGRGELLPFASYYKTGFLNEKPLATLRGDMAAIGITRAEGVKEPEDHIASLMDMMAGLIRGDFGRPHSIAEQASFFNKHISSWADLFFADLEAANKAVFFAPLGTVGRAFMDIEGHAFDMGAAG